MKEFNALLAEALEREEPIQANDKFRNYHEWDSLAVFSVLAMIDENYDVTKPRAEFEKLQTVSDLYDKIMESRRG